MSAPVNHRVTETQRAEVGGWVGCEPGINRVLRVLRERFSDIEGSEI